MRIQTNQHPAVLGRHKLLPNHKPPSPPNELVAGEAIEPFSIRDLQNRWKQANPLKKSLQVTGSLGLVAGCIVLATSASTGQSLAGLVLAFLSGHYLLPAGLESQTVPVASSPAPTMANPRPDLGPGSVE